jgi:hypothetical protein
MPDPIVPPQYGLAQTHKRVLRQLDDERNGQLIAPVPYPATPFGGGGAPSSTWYIPITAAAFDGSQATQPWIIVLDRVARFGVKVQVPWTTDATTAGQLRLSMGFALNSPTSPIVLPANSSGVASFKWLHGWPLWEGANVWIVVEATRTVGAGNVNIGFPRASLVGPEDCTVSGL